MILGLLGLPGVGKSTLARALGRLSYVRVFSEPEEQQWPDFVRSPHPNGAFTRLSWFRSQRVPSYYEAAELRSEGKSAILDSYYDKWCTGWLGAPGLEWLIANDDPYMPAARELAAVDAQLLPAADVVVLIEIDEDHWLEQISQRARLIDRYGPFRRSHHTQAEFARAAQARSKADGTRVIRHRRMRAEPLAEAAHLLRVLDDQGFSFQSETGHI